MPSDEPVTRTRDMGDSSGAGRGRSGATEARRDRIVSILDTPKRGRGASLRRAARSRSAAREATFLVPVVPEKHQGRAVERCALCGGATLMLLGHDGHE